MPLATACRKLCSHTNHRLPRITLVAEYRSPNTELLALSTFSEPVELGSEPVELSRRAEHRLPNTADLLPITELLALSTFSEPVELGSEPVELSRRAEYRLPHFSLHNVINAIKYYLCLVHQKNHVGQYTMPNKDAEIFELLKQKIVEQMQRSYPGINPDIGEWKGQDIVNFQEELLIRVNAHISEKWFYNHMKSRQDGLPRIDMLNLLSKYTGYTNWDEFRFKNSTTVQSPKSIKNNPNRFFIIVPALVLAFLVVFFVAYKIFSTRDYTFTFIDSDTRMPITNNMIEVDLLLDGESPVSYLCRPDGSFRLRTSRSNLRFVIRSPYYHTDTVFRLLNKFNRNEKVRLRPDNYALMLHYFSTMNVKDWQKRRNQLDAMISDSALIYQVYPGENGGLELFNKQEFINMLTMPASGLQGIEILDTRYQGEKMTLIRFTRKEVVR